MMLINNIKRQKPLKETKIKCLSLITRQPKSSLCIAEVSLGHSIHPFFYLFIWIMVNSLPLTGPVEVLPLYLEDTKL